MTVKTVVASQGEHRSNTPQNLPVADNNDFTARNKTNKSHGSYLTMEKGIFEGLKVLDCASFIAAPAAATVLSDFGADVIKIEPPGLGDPYRNLPNLPGHPAIPHNFPGM